MNIESFGNRKRASINIGGVYTSRDPAVVRTILGSCISVCLRDPIARVGGMNHFMLPGSVHDRSECTRYGVHAMEMLINGCMAHGADRNRLEAKVFGGGHVLRTSTHSQSVPQKNIQFVLDFLTLEKIKIVANDTGGYAARSVFFFTDTGRVLLKRLSETGADTQNLINEEKKVVIAPPVNPFDHDDVIF